MGSHLDIRQLTEEELNAQLALWLQSHYHQRTHSVTGHSPHDRFNAHGSAIRSLSDPHQIDELFYMRLTRRVRKDATVRLDNQLYEVDLSLRCLQIELRFDPARKHPVQIFHKGRYCGKAQPLDAQLNSQLHPQGYYEKQSR